jgi:hypothetical protein
VIIRVTRPVGQLLLVLPLLGLGASTAAADPLYSVTDLGPMSDGLNGGDSLFGDVSSQRRLTLDDSGHVTTTTWGSPAPYSGALPAQLTEGFGGGLAVVTSTAGSNLAGWGYGENTNNLGFVTIDGATKAVTPLPGDTFTQALAVNEQGYATGITGNASQVHPFFYSKYEGGPRASPSPAVAPARPTA